MRFIWIDVTFKIATDIEEITHEEEVPFGVQLHGIMHDQQRPTYCIISLKEINNLRDNCAHLHDVQNYFHQVIMATTERELRIVTEHQEKMPHKETA